MGCYITRQRIAPHHTVGWLVIKILFKWGQHSRQYHSFLMRGERGGGGERGGHFSFSLSSFLGFFFFLPISFQVTAKLRDASSLTRRTVRDDLLYSRLKGLGILFLIFLFLFRALNAYVHERVVVFFFFFFFLRSLYLFTRRRRSPPPPPRCSCCSCLL